MRYPSGIPCRDLSPSSRGLGHWPFTPVTGVRLPLGTPYPMYAGRYGFLYRPIPSIRWSLVTASRTLSQLAILLGHAPLVISKLLTLERSIPQRPVGNSCPLPSFKRTYERNWASGWGIGIIMDCDCSASMILYEVLNPDQEAAVDQVTSIFRACCR